MLQKKLSVNVFVILFLPVFFLNQLFMFYVVFYVSIDLDILSIKFNRK